MSAIAKNNVFYGAVEPIPINDGSTSATETWSGQYLNQEFSAINSTFTQNIEASGTNEKDFLTNVFKSISAFGGTMTFSIAWTGNNTGLCVYNYNNRRFIASIGSTLYCGLLASNRQTISQLNQLQGTLI